jgi:hypothetical protein
MNIRILKIAATIGLSCLTLAGCVSDGDGYDRGPRYHRPSYDGPRERPRYDRGDDRGDHRRWDRDGRRDHGDWQNRDDGNDRRERRRRHWMEDEG